MDFELWKEPRVVLASVLLLIIARAAYKRNQDIGQPPVVSYTVPWVGSALELGKSPDTFFERAMYVDHLFMCWGVEINSPFLVLSTGISLRSRPLDG